MHHPHGGCPILAFFARVGGDAAGATLVRPTPAVVYAVVVPALFAYAKDGAPASVVASAVEAGPPTPPTFISPALAS